MALSGMWMLQHLLLEASDLAEARFQLLQGRPRSARQLFEQHLYSWWYGRQAEAGWVVARTIEGDAPTLPAGASTLRKFPMRVLLQRLLQGGDFDAGLRLARLAEISGEHSAGLYAAAFLLELGRADEAARSWLMLPSDLKASRLGLALNKALRSLSGSAEVPIAVLDREGRPLGEIDRIGNLNLADGVKPRLIPRAALDHLRPHLGFDLGVPALRMSIDLELSRIAEKALGGFRGSIVLIDPDSGEILAALSDRKTLREGGTPAFEQRLEPASISKLITVTAAFRAGVDVDSEISHMICRGRQHYQGGVLRCAFRAGPLQSADHAMAISCNVAFANLGRRVGRSAVLDELRRWGFGSTSGGFELGRILQPTGDERQLADLSIGLEAADITPLHAALLAAVMANNGRMPVPTLLHAEDGLLGFSPRRPPTPPGRRVVEPEWLPELLGMMREVVESGTASGVEPRGFPVAMKTGTGRNPDLPLHTNYIGIGPLPHPRVAFCVRITNFWSGHKLKYASMLVTRRLLLGLRDFYGSAPQPDLWSAADSGSDAETARGGGAE